MQAHTRHPVTCAPIRRVERGGKRARAAGGRHNYEVVARSQVALWVPFVAGVDPLPTQGGGGAAAEEKA